MTSAETLAHKRHEAESLIRRCAPLSALAQFIEALRSAIVLKAMPIEDAQIPLGASKFGGAPDVPAGFEWPTWKGKSLGFCAQINLQEIVPFDVGNQLPDRGILLFFMALDEENPIWGEPNQREGWRVMWGDEPLQRLAPPVDSYWIAPQNTQRVTFDLNWVIDEVATYKPAPQELEWELIEEHPHRMLTCPYVVQLSPLIVAANGIRGRSGFALYEDTTATDDWLLLLQLDTLAGEFFAGLDDVGWVYFMIRREDLTKRDFSRVWFNQQCT